MKVPPIKMVQKLFWLTQLGLSLTAPVLLCLWIAEKLRQWLGLGIWVTVVALAIGLAGSACGTAKFFGYFCRESTDPKKEKPVSYNDHE